MCLMHFPSADDGSSTWVLASRMGNPDGLPSFLSLASPWPLWITGGWTSDGIFSLSSLFLPSNKNEKRRNFYKIRVNPPGIWHSVSQTPATWLGDSDGTRACGGVPLLLYEAPGLLSAVGLGSAQHWGLQNSLSRTSSHLSPQDPDPSPGPGSWQEEQGILGDRGSGLLILVPSLLCYSSGECPVSVLGC